MKVVVTHVLNIMVCMQLIGSCILHLRNYKFKSFLRCSSSSVIYHRHAVNCFSSKKMPERTEINYFYNEATILDTTIVSYFVLKQIRTSNAVTEKKEILCVQNMKERLISHAEALAKTFCR